MSSEKVVQIAEIDTSQQKIPAKAKKPAAGNDKLKKRRKTIIDVFRAAGALGAEFRRICEGINWSADSSEKLEGPKQVLITSSVANEGKSTIAAFLALTAATYLDQKILLLDCDMRRPAVHRLFGETLPGGLSDCLSGSASFDSCVRATSMDKLKILTAGTAVSDPTELLTAGRWPDLIAEASFYFDRIVVKCAPVIPVDDAVVAGRDLDGVLLVVRTGRTQREVARRATQIIRDSRLNLLGIVVNDLDEALPYYYSRKYYGSR